MTLFNPFDKQLDEVEYDDLEQLSENEVAEGFYAEYKEQMPSNKQIAKGVSSFANTDGGLFFLGIEDDDEDNVPVAFPGIDISGKVETKEKIRNVIKGRISPPPNFKTRLIHNPDEEKQAVAIVSVPKSHSTPHITNDGRIYRRLGEGSDPYDYETDARAIDNLTNRRESWNETVRQFCQPDLGFTQGQDDWSFIELYGVPSTLDNPVCLEVLEDLDGFRNQLAQTTINLGGDGEESGITITMGKSMDSIRTTSSGAVGHIWNRGARGEVDTAHTPTTFAFYTDGGMKSLLPLFILPEQQDSSEPYEEIRKSLDGNLRRIDFIDGKSLLVNILHVYNAYIGLLDRYGWFESEGVSLEMKINLNNIYRTILFFDSDWYVDFVTQYGPPICYESSVSIPRSGTYPLPMDRSEITVIGFELLQRVLEGFGIPPEFRDEVMHDFENYMRQIERESTDIYGRGPFDG